MSKYQYRTYRNQEGIPAPKGNGGKLSNEIHRTSLKYAEDARGSFGVAVRKDNLGDLLGIKCKPFNYT